MRANSAIFCTRLIRPTTRRTWASSYSSPELLLTRTKPFEIHLRLSRVGNADVIGRPTDAAGEIGDLDRRLAVHFALHVPIEHLRLGVGEGRVQHRELLAVRKKSQFDRRGVDERIGPTELQRIGPRLEAHLAGFAHQRQVFGVVDRKLHGIAVGHGRQIDVLRPGRSPDQGRGGKQYGTRQ